MYNIGDKEKPKLFGDKEKPKLFSVAAKPAASIHHFDTSVVSVECSHNPGMVTAYTK